jgi:hypothetical protein
MQVVKLLFLEKLCMCNASTITREELTTGICKEQMIMEKCGEIGTYTKEINIIYLNDSEKSFN